MIIVSKSLLISSDTAIVRAGRAIWLKPLVVVMFNVCCVLYSCCVGVFDKVAVM